MDCLREAYVHVYAPPAYEKRLHRMECHDCKRERAWFVSFYYEWYGPQSTCLHCGRSWSDGEWMPLSFERASRAKSIASAKAHYRATTVIPLAEMA